MSGMRRRRKRNRAARIDTGISREDGSFAFGWQAGRAVVYVYRRRAPRAEAVASEQLVVPSQLIGAGIGQTNFVKMSFPHD